MDPQVAAIALQATVLKATQQGKAPETSELVQVLLDDWVRLRAALERVYTVARYGEEGRDDYENLNTIIETAGRLLGKPEGEWHSPRWTHKPFG